MAEILLGGKKLVDLKVTELKAELDKRGLPKKGVKSVLLTRLKNAILREELAQVSPVKLNYLASKKAILFLVHRIRRRKKWTWRILEVLIPAKLTAAQW